MTVLIVWWHHRVLRHRFVLTPTGYYSALVSCSCGSTWHVEDIT